MANRQGYSRENKKCLELLADLRRKAGNKVCAECGDKQATWCSTNLGVFVCIRCSGVHRKMGTHISKVKSSTLDKWTLPLFEHFKRQGGNNVVNSIYEAKLGRHPKPKPKPYGDDMEVEAFIRDKYEHKTWYSKKKHRKWVKKVEAEEAGEEESEDEEEVTAKPAAQTFSPPSQSYVSSAVTSQSQTAQSSTSGLQSANFMDDFASAPAAPSAPANDGWTDFNGFSNGSVSNPQTMQQGQSQGQDSFFTDALFESSQQAPQGQTQDFGPFFATGSSAQATSQGQFGAAQAVPEKPVDPEQLKRSRNSILGKFHEKPQTQFMTQLPPNIAMQQGLVNPMQMQQMQMQQMQMQRMQMAQMAQMAQMQQMRQMQGMQGMGMGMGMSRAAPVGSNPMGMQGMPPMPGGIQAQTRAPIGMAQQFPQMGASRFPQSPPVQQFPAMGYQSPQQVMPQMQQQPSVDLSQPVHFGPRPKRHSKSDELFADLMA